MLWEKQTNPQVALEKMHEATSLLGFLSQCMLGSTVRTAATTDFVTAVDAALLGQAVLSQPNPYCSQTPCCQLCPKVNRLGPLLKSIRSHPSLGSVSCNMLQQCHLDLSRVSAGRKQDKLWKYALSYVHSDTPVVHIFFFSESEQLRKHVCILLSQTFVFK